MNCIRIHLTSKILQKYKKICKKLAYDGFLYFDSPVGEIDRVGKGFLFKKESILHTDWRDVKDIELIDAFKQLKNNKVFFYQTIDKKVYKTRLKIDKKGL
jgi:hypothetical protein